MGQFQLRADPNSINLAGVQSVIDDLNSRPGAQQFLNLKLTTDSGNFYVTDNKDSPILSQANKNKIDSNPGIQGLDQAKGVHAAWIDLDAPSGKSPTNILVHEVGHQKWPGAGDNDQEHDPVFYRLLNDSLKALGLPVDPTLDLQNVPIDNVPSPVPAGSSPLNFNQKFQKRSDAGDDDSGNADLATAQDPHRWQVSSSPDGKTINETELSSDGGVVAKIDYTIGSDGIEQINTSSYSDGALERQEDVFANGSSAIKYLDPRNTHPYTELDVDTDSTGKPTAVQMKVDGQNGNTAAIASVGQVLGSALGRALAPNNQFGQIAIGTVAGAIGQQMAQTFAASLATDASKFDFSTAFADFRINIAGAGAGAVASFLTAELGHALGLTGFKQELFNVSIGTLANGVANKIASDLAHLTFDGAIGAIDWGNAVTGALSNAAGNIEPNIASMLGSYLGHELVPAQTHEGAVGGQLLGAVGSAIGIAFGAGLGAVLNFIIPGIGSLIGTIAGTLIGDAIGSHPHPAAVDTIDPAGDHYGFTHSSVADGGTYDAPDKMAAATDDIINAYLKAVHGMVLDHTKQTMVGYVTDPDFRYVNGWVPTQSYLSFISPYDAAHAAALDVLQHIEMIGGDLLVKRAHQNLNRLNRNRNRSATGRRRIRGSGWRPAKVATASMAYILKRLA